ncbi:MAG TPA: hypothetical protein VGL13_05745, partial [Polyangiaceae bacterium]
GQPAAMSLPRDAASAPPLASTPPVSFPTRAAWSVLDPLLGARANRGKLLLGTVASAALVVAVLADRHAAHPSAHARTSSTAVLQMSAPVVPSDVPSSASDVSRENAVIAAPENAAAESLTASPATSDEAKSAPAPRAVTSANVAKRAAMPAVTSLRTAKPKVTFDPLGRRK